MRKEFFFVCTALVLLVLGTYIPATLLVPYAKTLNGTSMSIGIIYSCMYIVRLLFGTPIGRIAQKKEQKRYLHIALYYTRLSRQHILDILEYSVIICGKIAS
ncbi:MAG: hypothetical protein K0R55_3946 [Sporomusa sp.]|jgi:MFS family permease|nr:hypothetical protein [Sporomusa sp.]